MIIFESDLEGFGVAIVFVDTVFDAVVVDLAVIDEEISGGVTGEETIAGVMESAVPDDEMFASFDEEGGGIFAIKFEAFATGELEWGAGAADIEIFDEEMGGSDIGGFGGASDFDHAAFASPVVEIFWGDGVASVDDGAGAIWGGDASDDDGFFGGASDGEDEFFVVRIWAGVDSDDIAWLKIWPRDFGEGGEFLVGADFVSGGEGGGEERKKQDKGVESGERH